jgi:hypothetical protein
LNRCKLFGLKGLDAMKTIGLMMLLVGAAGSAMAGFVVVPEIDSASAAGALALLSGALLVIRGRRRTR